MPFRYACKLSDGIGLLCVISHVVGQMKQACEDSTDDMFTGVLQQLCTWKDEKDELFLYNRSVVL